MRRSESILNRTLSGLDKNPAAVRARLDALEFLMERSIRLPFLKKPVGLDALLGLLPVVGDVASGIVASYFIWEAKNLGMPKWQLARMAVNVGVDTALGAIPLVGDLFDFVFKSNTKNLRILRKHLDRHHPASAIIEGVAHKG